MKGYEIVRRIFSFLYIVLAVVCGYLVIREFPIVYGQTVKYYTLLGMGVAVGYVVLVHLYREMVSCRKAELSGIYSVGSCCFSLLCLYLMKNGLLVEDTCFFVVVLSFIFIIECTRTGNRTDDIRCVMCKLRGRKPSLSGSLGSLLKVDESEETSDKASTQSKVCTGGEDASVILEDSGKSEEKECSSSSECEDSAQ